MNKGLYIHIPFCRRKCAYCDFYSSADYENKPDPYTDAVIRNIPEDVTFDTVYFGGGTPSLMSGSHMEKILGSVSLSENAEISAEMNPDSADEQKLADFRKAGINRISVGVQSFDERELSALGRLHDPKQAEKAILSAKNTGFENISADLMLGIPYQDEKSVIKSIERLVALGVTHISAYMLKIEKGTPLASRPELIKECADEDKLADIYLSAVGRLDELGFKQYEISNFAASGYECRHNLIYWCCGEYLGIGPSAHSCMNGRRFAVQSDTDSFISDIAQRTYITDPDPCSVEERMMLSLRLTEGFDAKDSGEAADRIIKKAALYEKQGLLNIKNGVISLTPKGFLVSNEIIALLSEEL